jgi:hypothetical protein
MVKSILKDSHGYPNHLAKNSTLTQKSLLRETDSLQRKNFEIVGTWASGEAAGGGEIF